MRGKSRIICFWTFFLYSLQSTEFHEYFLYIVFNNFQAMAQFKSMFPDLSAQIIEAVLRKHNGDVSRTIDELLEVSGENNASQASSSSAYFPTLPSPPPYDAVASSSCNRQTVKPPVPSPRDKSVDQTRTTQPK